MIQNPKLQKYMKALNDFVPRALTGLFFVIVLAAAIIGGATTFFVLFALISALCTREFCSIITASSKNEVRLQPFILMTASLYLFVAFTFYGRGAQGAEIFVPYLILLMGILVRELYLKQPDPIGNWAYAMLSQLYIALPFALLSPLSLLFDPKTGTVTYYYSIPLCIFIFLWMNDTGAFCLGSLFGKHRLFERISPKKSWEGFWGGLVVSVASGISVSYAPQTNNLTMGEWTGLALVVSVFGTWGDLVESFLKRQLGLKDSGKMLPGHGGMLDRFDSSLLAIPAAMCYLYLIKLI